MKFDQFDNINSGKVIKITKQKFTDIFGEADEAAVFATIRRF
jgi:hypothetical protein